MQREITAPVELLDQRGHLTVEGWARHPRWRYRRSRIKAGWHRIKEWDYYAVLSQEGRFCVTITVSDLGYMGLFALCWLDLKRGHFHQVERTRLLPMGRSGLPESSDRGRVRFSDPGLEIELSAAAGRRELSFSAPGLRGARGERGIEGQVTLRQPPELESLNIATSWRENRRAFYYNRKINCMPAEGAITVGSRRLSLDPERDFGTLDWGRGRWTYKNRWFWGSASGLVGGHRLGWNIGYGFSDRRPASENALFYDGVAHKLSEVIFQLDPSDYLHPWHFTSDDGRFEMDFEPIVDRSSAVDLLLISSIQHQVFGAFTGAVVLDDGRRVAVERLLGFAEDVRNRW